MGRPIVTIGVVALGVVVIATAGLPVPVGVVTSGSMEPVLSEGDIYLALPPVLLGGASVDDIAIFHGEDGWVVHRLVDRTEHGFITAGDANVFVDQADGAPPIPASAVEGIVPFVLGRPVALPHLGIAPTHWQALIVGLGAVAAIGGITADEPTWAPTPVVLGVVVAAFVVLSWLLRPPPVEPESVASVVNAGPLPHMVFYRHEHWGSTAVTAWPGSSTPVPPGWQPRTILGWAPRPLVDLALRIDEWVAVGVVAGTSGVLFGGTASVIGRLAPRAVVP